MRILILCLWALLAGTPALAAREPIIAPIPDWVEQIDVPEPNPELRDRHFQNLLVASQSLYGPEGSDHFLELAFLVQTLQGLQGAGNISLPWQPDHSDLIIHKVHILRGNQVIDLLAQGDAFTVLRRENNLESAMLDGALTAVMQAEGLGVGDVLNVAFTVRRRPGALSLGRENLFVLMHGNPIGRYYVRQIWPESSPMRWRGQDLLAEPRIRTSRLGRELVLDRRNVEGPKPPERAPARYAVPALLQMTAFRDWGELSATVAPYYDEASELAPDSPLRVEIERIASRWDDPRSRAMAALRLVQDEIRYFALVMGDGNYLPATADQTWTRRYGDCKGKAVTLVALLRGLGIEAEPFLVHSMFGDALGDRLPQMAMFDHVIVRARIDGRSYWLDGTRVGDRELEELASSIFGWGLAVRQEGAELEEMPFAPPLRPLLETKTVYDGSSGFAERVPATTETIYRGDGATMMRTMVSQVGREAFLRQMRENGGLGSAREFEIQDAELLDDAENGAFTLRLEGVARLPWRAVPGARTQRFRFDNGTTDWDPRFDREDGPFRDVPFALEAPAYVLSTETVILPDGGRGYAIEGSGFDHVMAGSEIRRDLRLADGRAVMQSSFRHIARELSADEAKAATDRLREIIDDEAFLIAPAGTVTLAATPNPSRTTNDPEELVRIGFAKMQEGRYADALEDLDRAIALAPDWALPHANRGVALTHLDRLEEAEAALANAMRRDRSEFVVYQGYGYLHLRRDNPEDAVRSLTRSLELEPGNRFSLARRTDAYLQLGRFDDALADLDAILSDDSDDAYALLAKARIHARRSEPGEALAAADAALAADPDNFLFAAGKADVLWRLDRQEEAQSAYGEALRLFDAMLEAEGADPHEQTIPIRIRFLVRSGRYSDAMSRADAWLRRYPGNFRALTLRCWLRMEANVELERALRDCNESLDHDPDFEDALFARGLVFLRMRRWNDAIRAFDRVLSLPPPRSGPASETAPALFGRALARREAGDGEGSASDFAMARRQDLDIDFRFEQLGLLPRTAAAAVD